MGTISDFPTDIHPGITICYVQGGDIDGVSMYGVCLTFVARSYAIQIIEDVFGRGLFVRYNDANYEWKSWKKIQYAS